MRLLGVDMETTGLDTGNDRIIEVGAVLWDTDTKKPLKIMNEFIDIGDKKIDPAASKVNGITDDMLFEFGKVAHQVFLDLEDLCFGYKAEYLVAHNAENFDKPILMAELQRHDLYSYPCLKTTPWIDTRTDIPYDTPPSSRRLNHLAADLGFVNPFQHRAVFDVLTMLRVLSQYDINAVLEYQKIPFVTLQALVNYDNRQLAKDQRFSWEQIGDQKYPKMWVKRVKLNQVETEIANCQFSIKEIA